MTVKTIPTKIFSTYSHKIDRLCLALSILSLIILASCTGPAEPIAVTSATIVTDTQSSPSESGSNSESISKTEELEPTLTMMPTKTLTETPTSVPSPMPKPTVTPAPTTTTEPTVTSVLEVVLDAGDVRYEFVDPATNEKIAVALPQEWVSIIGKAEIIANQEYQGIPLAYNRVEGEIGSRQLKAGYIVIAQETASGWKRNQDVYTIQGYLGFVEAVLAQDVPLGSADALSTAPNQPISYNERSTYLEGIGTVNITYVTGVTPISATRTHLLINDGSQIIESARMKITFTFRDESNEIQQFTGTIEHEVYDDDVPVPLSTWNPPLGMPQKNMGLYWAKSGALVPTSQRETYLTANNYAFFLYGLAYLTDDGPSYSKISAGSHLELPYVRIDNMEDIVD